MSRIIDRRLNGRHKSAINRQRFMRRFKKQIQDVVRHAITNRAIKDIEKNGEKITIPAKDILEPNFTYGEGGFKELVLPGNKDFVPGDLIHRPKKGGAELGGSEASNSPESTFDDFVFEISKDEFLEIFFDDLALPHLVKRQLARIPTFRTIRAGHTREGTPSNINVLRSLQSALGRRIVLTSEKRKQIEALEKEIALLQEKTRDKEAISTLEKEIESIKERITKIPFIDPFDLRYKYHIKQSMPSTSAVMFCIMDVSGSMDEIKKDIAKRFFILLYLFLSRNYENVEIVFIRHHTSAKEVGEQEFFYSRETGGTVVSSALELMKDIIEKRFPLSDWNIYAAQASDGDNWNNDSPRCHDILVDYILPYVQYFAYVEIMPRHHQSLWEAYLTVKEKFPQFAMQHIEDIRGIYPVFKALFQQQEESVPPK